MRIFQINCFCTSLEDSGNPAAVVIDCDALTPTEKQSIAKEMNFPVTTFVSNITNSMPVLEYFYPDTQMPLCLHGTIAAAHWLFNAGGVDGDKLRCKRLYNDLFLPSLLVHRSNADNFLVEVVDHEVNGLNFNYLELATKFLQLPQDSQSIFDTELLFGIASVGSPKLFIPIKTKKLLDNIIPDQAAITKWSIEHKINGLYVYTRDESEKDTFHARGFNPRTGYLEDAATGVAAGALACGLKQNLTVFQGSSIARPSKIQVSYIGNGVSMVGGLSLSGNELTH